MYFVKMHPRWYFEMEWSTLFMQDSKPTLDQVSKCINNPLWDEFNNLIKTSYDVAEKLEYSKCSLQRGWNIKYPKKGKNLCTIYPQAGSFKALVVINERKQNEADFLVATCCDLVKQLYQKTKYVNGNKWLMIDVEDATIMKDTLRLIALRMQK